MKHDGDDDDDEVMMRTCSLLPARYICTLIHFFFRLQRFSGQSRKVKLALDAQIRATNPTNTEEKHATNTGQFLEQILVVRGVQVRGSIRLVCMLWEELRKGQTTIWKPLHGSKFGVNTGKYSELMHILPQL